MFAIKAMKSKSNQFRAMLNALALFTFCGTIVLLSFYTALRLQKCMRTLRIYQTTFFTLI